MMRGLVLCAALVFSAVATPAAKARIVDQAANGFTVENSQWVPTDPAASWKALVDDVGKWWPADHTWWGDASKLSISPEAGGCFCEMDGTRQAWHMTVVFVDPGKTLRMAGGLGPLQGMGLSGALEWRFAEEKGGTRITLWYRAGGYAPDDLGKFVPVIDQVQGLQLGGLADYLRKQAALYPGY